MKPKHAQSEYRDRKNFQYYSSLSALVDYGAAFMSVDIGFPWKAYDARIYRTSKLFGKAQNHFGLHHMAANVLGHRQMPYMLGDPSYPLAPSLI